MTSLTSLACFDAFGVHVCTPDVQCMLNASYVSRSTCMTDIRSACWDAQPIAAAMACHKEAMGSIIGSGDRDAIPSCTPFHDAAGTRYAHLYLHFLTEAMRLNFPAASYRNVSSTCIVLANDQASQWAPEGCTVIDIDTMDSVQSRGVHAQEAVFKGHVHWPQRTKGENHNRPSTHMIPLLTHTLFYTMPGSCGKWFDKNIFDCFMRNMNDEDRDIDVLMFTRSMVFHQETATKGRARAKQAVESLRVKYPELNVVLTANSTEMEYFKMMRRSKILISPWGYGQWSWKDFEALLAGALVVKPWANEVCFLDQVHCVFIEVDTEYEKLEAVVLETLSNLETHRNRRYDILSKISKHTLATYALTVRDAVRFIVQEVQKKDHGHEARKRFLHHHCDCTEAAS